MTANLGFVAHAAQRDAGKLPTQGIGHAFAQRSFADAGRTHETKNRTFQFVLQLDDSQEFQQSVLHFGQAIMLLVQNARRRGQIDLVLG